MSHTARKRAEDVAAEALAQLAEVTARLLESESALMAQLIEARERVDERTDKLVHALRYVAAVACTSLTVDLGEGVVDHGDRAAVRLGNCGRVACETLLGVGVSLLVAPGTETLS